MSTPSEGDPIASAKAREGAGVRRADGPPESRSGGRPRRGAEGPPRARLAFRVGVVGHRPHRLPSHSEGLEAIRARLAQILGDIAEAVRATAAGPAGPFYADAPPTLFAFSSLAEGADRLFAEEALNLGYHLCCVMPFAQAEFEADFRSPEAAARGALEGFHALLARAEGAGALTRFELDGEAGGREKAYDGAARVVLNQSDLLIAIWDGSLAGGVGGTAASLLEAVEFGIPVVWIDAHAPQRCRVLRDVADIGALEEAIEAELEARLETEDDADSGANSGPDQGPDSDPGAGASLAGPIAELVRSELDLPPGEVGRAHLAAYFAEHRPRLNLAFAWKVFRELVGQARFRAPPLLVRDYEEIAAPDWPVETGADPNVALSSAASGAAWINRALRAPFAWADGLAERWADAHRSGFIWTSLLGAGAVLLALLPMAAGWAAQSRSLGAAALLEGAVLAVLVTLPVWAQRRRWHQRWLEYRVLAEMIRELRILTPLGGARPLPRARAHLAGYGDPAASWMYWQTRAVARSVGVPNARVDQAYLTDQAAHLAAFLGAPNEEAEDGTAASGGQIGFHHANSERMERIHHRLHLMALTLFAITILGVIFHLTTFLDHIDVPHWVDRWMIFTAAFLPALAAALASVNNLGEFARLHRRSAAMAQGLSALALQLARLRRRPTGPRLADLAEIAGQTAAMMVDENIDWRIVVLDLPHAAG